MWRWHLRAARSARPAVSSPESAPVARETSSDGVVLRQHLDLAVEGVDGEQGVVGDDQVRGAGPLPRELGEAILAEGALARAEAFAGADRDRGPDAVGDAGGEVVAFARLGLLRPLAHAQHVAAHLGQLVRVEQAVLLGLLLAARVDLVQADVVVPPLEQREFGGAVELGGQRLADQREVVRHELPLQGERRGGHDDAALLARQGVRDCRDQVRERLSGTGARLDEQRVALAQRLGDRLGHLLLTRARRTADRTHRGIQQPVEISFSHSG